MNTKQTEAQQQRQEIKDLLKTGKAFRFLGEQMQKSYTGEDGEYYVEAIGSSDQEDLVGDVMTPNALEQMREGFVGKTVFMNHRTNVPDDVFGSVVETKILKENGMQLLWFKIVVEKENEAALKSYRMINGGRTKLSTSVTVLVNKATPNPKRKNAIIIDEVEAIEFSIVGVGCNRESKAMAASAKKSLELAAASFQSAILSTTDSVIKTMKTLPTPGAATTGTDIFARTTAARKNAETALDAVRQGNAAPEISALDAVQIKGLFNDILNEPPSFWKLTDILGSVKWDLAYQKYAMDALGQTDYAPLLQLWAEALGEFTSAATKCFPSWIGIETAEEEAAETPVTEMDDDEAMMISNALELEKSFAEFVKMAKTRPVKAQLSLQEIGKQFLASAKSLGIPLETAETATVTTNQPGEPALEQIENSPLFKAMRERAEKAERELQTTVEISKAGLRVALEAQETSLRQPLQFPKN